MLTKKLRNQKGFTLIEIIAVLVILGILAAVAVPKYMDLQNNAHKAAVDGALAAASSNVNLAYAKYLVSGGNNASITGSYNVSGTGGTAVSLPINLGDFNANYSGGTTGNCVVALSSGPNWLSGYASGGGSINKTFACPWDQTP